MPQDTTTMNPTTQTLSEDQLIRDPASIEVYADQLMDDIFDDVERVLDGGAKLPKDPVEPEFISLKSIKVPQIILPPLARDGFGEDGSIDTDVSLRDASAGKDQSFDRILLGTAFASLLITLSLWLATRGGFNRLFAPDPVAVPANTPVSAQTQANIKFADYIQRSLTAIEQNTTQTIPLLPPFPETPIENLPPIQVPSTDTPLGAETSNLIAAINRMADSIQEASNRTAALSNQVMQSLQVQAQQQAQQQPQAAQPVQTPTPGGQTSGTVTVPPTQTAQTPQAEPQPTQQAQAAPEPAPSQPATASVSIPAPVIAPAPAPAPAPAASEQPTEEAAATVNPSSAALHTLVGILELGDRSAALFEVNGVARRIYVGESIAASGWTLVEVVNQEAVIRRNGEVLTIYVGQQF